MFFFTTSNSRQLNLINNLIKNGQVFLNNTISHLYTMKIYNIYVIVLCVMLFKWLKDYISKTKTKWIY